MRKAVAAVVLCILLAGTGTAPRADAQKLDINKATHEELTRVKGIGDKKAAAILQFIRDHGPVRKMDELLEVRGVGEKTLDRLKEVFEAGGGGRDGP